MKCEHAQSDLQDYLEDFLSPGEKRDLEGHIRECKTCQIHLKAARRLERSLQGLTLSTPPARFTAAIVTSAIRQHATHLNRCTAAIVSYVASAFLTALGVSATLGFQELRRMIGALRGLAEPFLNASHTITLVPEKVLDATESVVISPLGLAMILLVLLMLTSTLLTAQLTANTSRR